MIDCHTHISDGAFAEDRAAVLRRAWEVGVTDVAVVGQDLAENRAVLDLARGYAAQASGDLPRLLPFLGLHPDRFADRASPIAEAEQAAILDLIRQQAAHIVGIGEVGLDYWLCQDEQRRAMQREALGALAALAAELKLPLNVHSRSAGRHTLQLLLDHGAEQVLMHAFDAKAGTALPGVEAGYLFSIPPSIVRSPQKQKLVRLLPLSALALETDSPVLGPVAGERNVPANAALSVRAIAEIKGVTEQEVREATTENARRLFRLPPPSTATAAANGAATAHGSREGAH